MTIHTYPFGWVTPFVAGRIDRDKAKLNDFLALTRPEWHFLGFILAHAVHWNTDDQYADEIWRVVFTKSRKDIMKQYAPFASIRLLKAIPKFGGDIWHANTYRAIANTASCEAVQKYFAHRKIIERKHVKWMTRLPEHMRDDAVIKYLEKGRSVDEMIFAYDIVRVLRHDLDNDQILKSLAKSKGFQIRDWVNNQMQQMTFPEAPWAGVDTAQVSVRPLINFDDLKRTSLEFKNCIRTYLSTILRGNSYFYRYEKNGKPTAVVEITKLPALGWTVNEALGVDYDDLSNATKRDIALVFKEGGIAVPPLNIYPQSWMNIY